MSSLTGHKIKDTYQSLLKTNDNGLITTAFKQITDGSGSASGLYLKNNGVEISGSLIVNGIDIINGNIVEIPFLNNQTDDVNIIKNYQNIINHGDLLVKLNDTLIIEEGAQYLILGQLINNGTVVVSGSLIANQGITGPGSIGGPGTILNNTTIVTYDKANQAYGFPQLNANGLIPNNYRSVTTNTTLSIADHIIFAAVAAFSTVELILPDVALAAGQSIVVIKNDGNSENSLVILGPMAAGGSNYYLSAYLSSVTLVSNGVYWYRIAST